MSMMFAWNATTRLAGGEVAQSNVTKSCFISECNAGRVPKRVVIHRSTPFKPEEIDGCFDAWPNTRGLDLIHIQQDVMWRGVQINPPQRSVR